MYSYKLHVDIMPDVTLSDDEKRDYLKNCFADIEKHVKLIKEQENIVLEEFELDTVHVGSPGVADGYVGGNYQAIDADDPSFIQIAISAVNPKCIIDIFQSLKNTHALEFINDVAIFRK